MSAEDKVEVNKIKDKADKVEVKAISDKVDTIIVPTKVSELTNDLAFQTKTEVNTAIQKVVGAAPEALDTLEEIATKLSDNDDAVAGIVNTLSDKANVGDSYTKTESDAKYLTTDAASNTYLPKVTYTASDILTKIKTVDGAGSGLDADLLDGVHGSSYLYASCHCGDQKTGVLVKTDVPEQNLAKFTVHINGNTHFGSIPIDTYIQFYSYNNSKILGWTAINNGANFGAINVFMYEGYVCLWLPQPWDFMTFNIFVNYTNTNALRYNRVISATNTTMPTEGVTRLVTITPKQSALTTDNVASATKLQTARTIWGQPFDGTANVSGSLSGVEDINMKGTIYNVRYLKHAGIPDGVGALSPALGIGPSPDNYGLFLWGRNNGQGYMQVGRKDGTQTAYDLILQNFGGNVGIGTETPSERLDVNGNVKATQFIKTGGTASQFLKADGSVDTNTYLTTGAASNSYLLSSAYTAADILTKIKTVDGAGSGLDADTLDGVHGKGYMYYNAYNFANGCLVRLKLLASGNDMVTVHIKGNSYGAQRTIDTWVQFYNYNSGDSIYNPAATHNGYNFGNINVFCYDGHVYLWFKQTLDFQSFSVYAECTNVPHIGNLVESITNAAMPTEGVTRLVTIVPKKSALTTDLSNVLKEDVVDGPILEEIENLTKEELKAELLGDVDSKLVTKVDKVEGKGLSTNDYTNAEKSKLSTLPTATEFDAALTAKQDKLVNSADITVGEDNKLSVTDAAVKKAFIKRWENLGTIYSDSLRGSYNKETDLFTITWYTRYPESKKYQPYFTYKQAMAALDAVTGPVLGNDSFAPSIPANLPPIGYPMSPGPKFTVVEADTVVDNYEIKTLMLSTVGPCTVTQTMVLTSAVELQAIIGNVTINTGINENPISFSSAGLGFPKLEYFRITIKKSFDVQTSPLLTFSTMQYLIANAANTSPITVTVHPDVYAKLTGDTTNAAASALTAGELSQWQALVTTANSKHISFATTSN